MRLDFFAAEWYDQDIQIKERRGNMNEVLNNIRTRRSVRSFTEKRIPQEAVRAIVEAATYAPSAMNRQSWHFTVVHNREKIQKLAEAIGQQIGREGYDFYKPDMLILVEADRENQNGQLDSGCAMENIMLAAHSLGVGSVWVNQAKGICDEPGVRKVLDEFGVPATHVIWGIAALGYAVEQPDEKPRAEGTVNFVE